LILASLSTTVKVLSTSNKAMAQTYLFSIKVVYQSVMPKNAISELDGKPADVNYGFGGVPVWLVPVYTEAGGAAVTEFGVKIQRHEDKRFSNLAQGTRGAYRYLSPGFSPRSTDKITEIRLFRPDDETALPPRGWDTITRNINDGRGGYLYLICKNKSSSAPSSPHSLINRRSLSNMSTDLSYGFPITRSGSISSHHSRSSSSSGSIYQLWVYQRVQAHDSLTTERSLSAARSLPMIR